MVTIHSGYVRWSGAGLIITGAQVSEKDASLHAAHCVLRTGPARFGTQTAGLLGASKGMVIGSIRWHSLRITY